MFSNQRTIDHKNWETQGLSLSNIYLDLDLIFLLFLFNLRILFFLHLALILDERLCSLSVMKLYEADEKQKII